MDDATQKLGTCPTCRHAEHEGHICLNMASDYDCGCDKRPAKVVDDATQKLVDGLRLDARDYGRKMRGEVPPEELISWDQSNVRAWEAADALEAAQRRPVSPEVDWSSTDRPHCVRCGERIWAGQAVAVLPSGLREHQDCDSPYRLSPEQRETIRALLSHHVSKVLGWARMKPERDYGPEWRAALYEATDAILARFSLPVSPPVSPPQREAVRAVVGEQLTRAGLDLDGPPFADDGETQWPVALELRDRMTDALLARFSLPVLDVEKVAQWLRSHDDYGVYRDGYLDAENIAAALVADLHTLTTDGTPSDTERNEK